MADPSWRPLAGGVAQRRRERRLRSWYRHEQQTVRMALAAFSHHSALRRQTKARAGEEGHEEHDALRRQKPPPPQPELFSLEEEPGGGLPAPLSEVAGRQEKVVRHVVEDLGSVCPVVQILDLPVPHRMDQLAELLNLEEDVLDAGRLLDRPISEQVIEVPKISLDVIPLRTMVPWQLVEVIVSFSSLQGLLWTFQFRVVEVVSVTEVFKVSQDRVQQRIVVRFPCGEPSRTLTFQFPDRTLHPASTSSVFVTECFSHFSPSAKVTSHPGSELPGSSTAAAQLEGSVEWVRFGRSTLAGRTSDVLTVLASPAGVDVVWYGEKDEEGGVLAQGHACLFILPPLPPG